MDLFGSKTCEDALFEPGPGFNGREVCQRGVEFAVECFVLIHGVAIRHVLRLSTSRND